MRRVTSGSPRRGAGSNCTHEARGQASAGGDEDGLEGASELPAAHPDDNSERNPAQIMHASKGNPPNPHRPTTSPRAHTHLRERLVHVLVHLHDRRHVAAPARQFYSSAVHVSDDCDAAAGVRRATPGMRRATPGMRRQLLRPALPVAVVGGREDRHHVLLVAPIVALHHLRRQRQSGRGGNEVRQRRSHGRRRAPAVVAPRCNKLLPATAAAEPKGTPAPAPTTARHAPAPAGAPARRA